MYMKRLVLLDTDATGQSKESKSLMSLFNYEYIRKESMDDVRNYEFIGFLYVHAFTYLEKREANPVVPRA